MIQPYLTSLVLFFPLTTQATNPILLNQTNIELAAITAYEVSFGQNNLTFDLGQWTNANDLVNLPVLNTKIRRELPELWYLEFDSASEIPNTMEIEYEINGYHGSRGYFNHISRHNQQIASQIIAIQPQIKSKNGTTILTGGIILILDIADIRYSGRYRGILTITINK